MARKNRHKVKPTIIHLPVNKATAVSPVAKNASGFINSHSVHRIRHDVSMWRAAVHEAEQAHFPHRVKMQTMYMDTVLNGHIDACMARYRDLALLKDFDVLGPDGMPSEELKAMLSQKWFFDFMHYAIDAQFYGYSLIALGDIVNSQFPGLQLVQRENVSPDRKVVTSYPYMISGLRFDQPPVSDWHIWVPTHNELGKTDCGYGMLYKIAIYEILLRNLLAYNGDFIELYAQPYRVGKTTKTEEDERAEFERMLQQMGSSGYAVLDGMDEIQFLETALGGTGYQGYDNLEARLEKKISKMILGHADAMDSTPGKLGGTQGEDNPIAKALGDKQAALCRFMENVINGQLIPKIKALGVSIPDGVVFRFSNNREIEEKKVADTAFHKQLADVALVMKNAGLSMSPQYFEDMTGIPVSGTAAPGVTLTTNQVKKLKNLYDGGI